MKNLALNKHILFFPMLQLYRIQFLTNIIINNMKNPKNGETVSPEKYLEG